jgi:hypothetical protein
MRLGWQQTFPEVLPAMEVVGVPGVIVNTDRVIEPFRPKAVQAAHSEKYRCDCRKEPEVHEHEFSYKPFRPLLLFGSSLIPVLIAGQEFFPEYGGITPSPLLIS